MEPGWFFGKLGMFEEERLEIVDKENGINNGQEGYRKCMYMFYIIEQKQNAHFLINNFLILMVSATNTL